MLQITDVDWVGDRSSPLVNLARKDAERKIREIIATNQPPTIEQKHIECWSQLLGEKADLLLYPSKRFANVIDDVFNALTNSIAVLAFVPGGIVVFGTHYQAVIDGSSKT